MRVLRIKFWVSSRSVADISVYMLGKLAWEGVAFPGILCTSMAQSHWAPAHAIKSPTRLLQYT